MVDDYAEEPHSHLPSKILPIIRWSMQLMVAVGAYMRHAVHITPLFLPSSIPLQPFFGGSWRWRSREILCIGGEREGNLGGTFGLWCLLLLPLLCITLKLHVTHKAIVASVGLHWSIHWSHCFAGLLRTHTHTRT